MTDPVSIDADLPLGFTSRWLELGVITPEQLEALAEDFRSGDDPNAEHFRYRAFREYLRHSHPLTPEMAEALYELGACDPDLAAPIMGDVLELRECPENLLERALGSDIPHVARTAWRSQMMARMEVEITDDLLGELLSRGDVRLQTWALELPGLPPLTREQVQRLAECGSNRRVRNIAAARLRRKRDPVNQA